MSEDIVPGGESHDIMRLDDHTDRRRKLSGSAALTTWGDGWTPLCNGQSYGDAEKRVWRDGCWVREEET